MAVYILKYTSKGEREGEHTIIVLLYKPVVVCDDDDVNILKETNTKRLN